MDPYATYYVLDTSDDDDTRNARSVVVNHNPRSRDPQPGMIRNPYGFPRPRPVRVVPAPAPVVVAAPAASMSTSILGNLDKSELAALIGEAVAALMPLPSAPTPTGDERDMANLFQYVGSLAMSVKRAEQFRLLGDAIAAFLD